MRAFSLDDGQGIYFSGDGADHEAHSGLGHSKAQTLQVRLERVLKNHFTGDAYRVCSVRLQNLFQQALPQLVRLPLQAHPIWPPGGVAPLAREESWPAKRTEPDHRTE